jgi:hypothetical protein
MNHTLPADPADRLDIIRQSNGRWFGVQFIKKDGSKRDMTCRLGVRKGVKGTGMAYDPFSKGLVPVYEPGKDDFRMVNLKTITRLIVNGEVYR